MVKQPITWWTAEQIAAYLGTTRAQVLNMRRRGQLPDAAKIPGVGLRWSEAEVRTWIERSPRASGAEPRARPRRPGPP